MYAVASWPLEHMLDKHHTWLGQIKYWTVINVAVGLGLLKDDSNPLGRHTLKKKQVDNSSVGACWIINATP